MNQNIFKFFRILLYVQEKTLKNIWLVSKDVDGFEQYDTVYEALYLDKTYSK